MRMLLVQSYSRLEAKDVLTTLALVDGVVDRVDTSEEAYNHISHHRYDIILLNDLVPDDAYRLARRLRTALGSTPVIILSTRSEPKIKAQAFSAGVDAYLTKPFDPGELTARIQAVARGLQACPHILRVGPLQINRDSGEVKVGQHDVSLTVKEFGVLELLVMRRGTALSKEVFLEHLYRGMVKPEPKIIDVFVCKTRHKLAHAGCEGLIKTIWGRGYMISDLRIIGLEEPPPAASTDGRTLIAA